MIIAIGLFVLLMAVMIVAIVASVIAQPYQRDTDD
jgi:hypothetical protein